MMGYELEQDDQAQFHQMQLERREMIEEALHKLAIGQGGEREINLLADITGVDSPYQHRKANA